MEKFRVGEMVALSAPALESFSKSYLPYYGQFLKTPQRKLSKDFNHK